MRLRITALYTILLLLSIFACNPKSNSDNRVARVEKIRFREQNYSIVYVDLKIATISLYWQQPNGRHFRNLQILDRWLVKQKKHNIIATNAGIFDPDYTPVGLHIENGKKLHDLNLNDGQGNFFLKPNGVFFIDDKGAGIVESSLMPAKIDQIRLATQSGPLLVLNNTINEKFKPDSTNRVVRSGVGVKSAKEVFLVISDHPVNLFYFAELFRERLACANALYLDGVISKLYSPDDRRIDDGEFAGILAVEELELKNK